MAAVEPQRRGKITDRLFRHDKEFKKWATESSYIEQHRGLDQNEKLLKNVAKFRFHDPPMVDHRLRHDPSLTRKPANWPRDLDHDKDILDAAFVGTGTG